MDKITQSQDEKGYNLHKSFVLDISEIRRLICWSSSGTPLLYSGRLDLEKSEDLMPIVE